MGLVASWLLAQSGRAGRVSLWCHTTREAEMLAQTRESGRLPHVRLPETVKVTSEGGNALGGADLVVVAVPVQFIRPVLERIAPHFEPGAGVVSVSKGVENETLLRPLEIVSDVVDGSPDANFRPLGVLSGPTIAGELARCLPATMVAASHDPDLASRVQALFTTSWLRVYTSDDPLGVEIAGAAKNVVAIAAGVLDGLRAGFNAKSALLARGLAEITRLGVALGADRDTFFGLAGVGDLATTCFSPEGRNRSCGEALGKGESLTSYLTRTESVVEGVATAVSLRELAQQVGVEMPIGEAVYRVVHEQQDPIAAIGELMGREPKQERIG
jgi:glycerol-3-phosphate dehydrogenase (NAD(P)+)